MRHQSSLHRLLARAILAWFALTLATAVASPITRMGSWQAICSSDSSSAPYGLVSSNAKAASGSDASHAADADHLSTHMLKCSLCLTLNEPPSAAFDTSSYIHGPATHVLRPIASTRLPSLAGAPLPPRGPPSGI